MDDLLKEATDCCRKLPINAHDQSLKHTRENNTSGSGSVAN